MVSSRSTPVESSWPQARRRYFLPMALGFFMRDSVELAGGYDIARGTIAVRDSSWLVLLLSQLLTPLHSFCDAWIWLL